MTGGKMVGSMLDSNVRYRCLIADGDCCVYMGGWSALQAENGWFTNRCRKVCHSSSSLSILVPSFFNFSKDGV